MKVFYREIIIKSHLDTYSQQISIFGKKSYVESDMPADLQY